MKQILKLNILNRYILIIHFTIYIYIYIHIITHIDILRLFNKNINDAETPGNIKTDTINIESLNIYDATRETLDTNDTLNVKTPVNKTTKHKRVNIDL